MIGDYPDPNEKTLEEIQADRQTGERMDKILAFFRVERERREERENPILALGRRGGVPFSPMR